MMQSHDEFIFADFIEKKVVSIYQKGQMKGFILDHSSSPTSSKEEKHLPNEMTLETEVKGSITGDLLVVWDARNLKPWKFKNITVFDLREAYEAKVRPLSLRLNDIALDEGLANPEDLVELDMALKDYENGQSKNLSTLSMSRALWCAKIEEKYRFLDTLESLRKLVGAPSFDYVMHGAILPIELLLKRIAKERRESLPRIKDRGGSEWYEGGYVLDPPIGFFQDLAIMDFSKYYPSIMMDFNISPEITKIENSRLALDFSKKGLIPEALGYLTKTRNEVEEKLGMAERGGLEWLRLSSDREAVKVLQNAMYGALASEQFSMQSRALAAAISALGREGLKETIAECERKGFKVIYADTDSVMALVPQDRAEVLAKDLTTHIQEYFIRKYTLPMQKPEIRLKFSRYARSAIFLGKKNYAFWDGKTVEIVGLFRQARSRFAVQFQKELFGRVLEGVPLEEIRQFYNDTIIRFRKASLEEIALCTVINQPMDKYKVASWHVKGARNAEALLGLKFYMGDTIKLIWLKGKPEIIGFEYQGQVEKYRNNIDWERMEDALKALAEPIMNVIGNGAEPRQRTLV
ncbi:MAG: hypothetical protein LUP94_00395 [Candidatus Methanomethylicus sp.]|nr:hypothetical protein [Candidatus Methanomethylicus sp.]